MLKSEAFDDNERKVVVSCKMKSVVKSVVPVWTPGSGHPVNDHVALLVWFSVDLETSGGNHHRITLVLEMPER
jgi:hypothetical protein